MRKIRRWNCRGVAGQSRKSHSKFPKNSANHLFPVATQKPLLKPLPHPKNPIGRAAAPRSSHPGVSRRAWPRNAEGVGAQLSDHHQGSGTSEVTGEGHLSKLGDSLYWQTGLCALSSRRVAATTRARDSTYRRVRRGQKAKTAKPISEPCSECARRSTNAGGSRLAKVVQVDSRAHSLERIKTGSPRV